MFASVTFNLTLMNRKKSLQFIYLNVRRDLKYSDTGESTKLTVIQNYLVFIYL